MANTNSYKPECEGCGITLSTLIKSPTGLRIVKPEAWWALLSIIIYNVEDFAREK